MFNNLSVVYINFNFLKKNTLLLWILKQTFDFPNKTKSAVNDHWHEKVAKWSLAEIANNRLKEILCLHNVCCTLYRILLLNARLSREALQKKVSPLHSFYWLLDQSECQMMTTEHGFILNSGFKKIWWPQSMVIVLNLGWQKIAYTKHSSTLNW